MRLEVYGGPCDGGVVDLDPEFDLWIGRHEHGNPGNVVLRYPHYHVHGGKLVYHSNEECEQFQSVLRQYPDEFTKWLRTKDL